jgi:hypothetical protein
MTESILNSLYNAMLKLLRYEHAPRHIQEAAMPPLGAS